LVEAWVYADNLRPFLTVLGWVVGYALDADDWTAISFGVCDSDAEADRWYDYEFAGRHCAAFSLGADPGTGVVLVRAQVPAELEPQVRLAADIFAHFRVQE
jgi:hypothetical protein